jgi:hypothetical protein
MNLQQVAKKYGVNENILNSKDDSHTIVIQSLKDLQQMVQNNQPKQQLVNRMQFLIDFISDVKNSSI